MAQRPYVGLTVDSFHKLDEALGSLEDVGAYVEDWMDDNGERVITEFITEHGLEVGYTVTDGDLAITLT